MGWFEHGSTIIVLAPPGVTLDRDLVEGQRVRMGEGLLREG
jgi:phosphatidylserine decarboxylase